MVLWIVSELFYPEENATGYILTHIANVLTKKYEVHVICGPAKYGGKMGELQGSKNDHDSVPSFELHPDIHLHRLDSKGYNKDSLLSRLKHQLGLSMGLRKMLKKNLSPGDLVLMVTNPAPLLLMLPKAVKKRGNKLFVIVHDVSPENLIPAGIVRSEKSLIYRFLKRLFDKAYRRADKLLALGRDMQEVLIKKLGKNPNNTEVVVVENWADDKLIVPGVSKSPKLGQEHNNLLTVQFAGNLGRVQGLDYFLRLFKEANNENLLMSFWGDGAIKKDLINYHLDNPELKIEFNDKYTRAQQNEVLNKADLSLITLADGMYGLGVPSKSYNIMAAGKPILFIGNFKSEIARVVQENGIGFCFEPSDREGIVGFLKNLSLERKAELEEMGKQARHLAETVYSQEIILSKYVSEIQ
jgi:glycosyltransferase involved in cell wall biosynthesis